MSVIDWPILLPASFSLPCLDMTRWGDGKGVPIAKHWTYHTSENSSRMERDDTPLREKDDQGNYGKFTFSTT